MEINWIEEKDHASEKQEAFETLQEVILFRMVRTVFKCWTPCAESCDGGLDLCVPLFATSCCKNKKTDWV